MGEGEVKKLGKGKKGRSSLFVGKVSKNASTARGVQEGYIFSQDEDLASQVVGNGATRQTLKEALAKAAEQQPDVVMKPVEDKKRSADEKLEELKQFFATWDTWIDESDPLHQDKIQVLRMDAARRFEHLRDVYDIIYYDVT